jgi:hypothetical protein
LRTHPKHPWSFGVIVRVFNIVPPNSLTSIKRESFTQLNNDNKPIIRYERVGWTKLVEELFRKLDVIELGRRL